MFEQDTVASESQACGESSCVVHGKGGKAGGGKGQPAPPPGP